MLLIVLPIAAYQAWGREIRRPNRRLIFIGTKMQNHLLTKREAASRARISERTLERHIAAQSGPALTRIGRRVLIREADFEKLYRPRLLRHRVEPYAASAAG